MKDLLSEDIQRTVSGFSLNENYRDCKFLITGATGLVGKCIVKFLLALNVGIRITIPVRSRDKAENIFGKQCLGLTIIECDLLDYTKNLDEEFDYVIHCASPTNGTYMSSHPVELYLFTISSTKNLLEYIRNKNCKGFVYLSSIEFYGQIEDDSVINEHSLGFIDFDNPRNSYPIAKQGAEFLCKAYASQYGVPAKIARLTQTFGAGVGKEDNRVFAQFARSIINNQDIELHTTGESAKSYCYTMDTVTGILYILLKGKIGHSYNIANEDTYISIKDLAYFLRDRFNPNIRVTVKLHPEYQYAPTAKLNLSTTKLKALGWKPYYSLLEMFNRLILSLRNECDSKGK